MANWITSARERVTQLLDYRRDLEAKNAYLRAELTKIASGIYLSDDEKYCQTTRLMLRASKALAEEGNMKNRKMDNYYIL